jgi:phenylacetate-coenzyme A ligase PaaK-like adenylate-forming protein
MPVDVTHDLAEFIATPLDAALAGADDEHAARDHALKLFHEVAREVPAYAKFLAEHDVDAIQIRTYADFEQLPLVTKANYHAQYPLRDLCRHGRLEANDFVAVSWGSTGQPTFWPRFITDEFAITRRFELAPRGDPNYFPVGVKHRYTRR